MSSELKLIGSRMGYKRVYYYEGEYAIVTGIGQRLHRLCLSTPSQKGTVMVIIKIMNEFLHGPVWTCEEETGIATDDLTLVHEDPTVASLNREIGELYDSYFEFDSHDQACWFNEEQEKADKPLMLELLGRLNARIAELNDGSFVVDDQETPRVEAL